MTPRFTTDAHRDAEQTLPQESPRTNWGIEAVVYAGQQFHKKSTSSQLKHALGVSHANLTDMEMREAADYLDLKSQITKLSIQAFNTLPLPALIEYQGGWKVMIQTDNNGWTVYDPATDSLHTLSFTPAESTAHYKVMLIADESLSVKEVKFGLS